MTYMARTMAMVVNDTIVSRINSVNNTGYISRYDDDDQAWGPVGLVAGFLLICCVLPFVNCGFICGCRKERGVNAGEVTYGQASNIGQTAGDIEMGHISTQDAGGESSKGTTGIEMDKQALRENAQEISGGSVGDTDKSSFKDTYEGYGGELTFAPLNESRWYGNAYGIPARATERHFY